MCSPPTIARCARTERTIPLDQRTPLPAHEDDWSVLHFQTCVSTRRPSKCSVPMLCSTCPRLRVSRAVHSRQSLGRTAEQRFGHTRIPSCTSSFAHARHDADFCHERKSDAAAPGRVGIRPCLSARSIRQSRHVLRTGRCSMNRACSFVVDKLACGTLRKTVRHGCIAGGCVAPTTREAWLALHDLAEEKGEHVRLD